MNNSNKNLWIGVVIAAAVILVIVFGLRNKTAPETVPASTDTSSTTGDTTSAGTKTGTSATASGPLSRADALIKYQDTMVRVTDSCLTTPYTSTFSLSKNTLFMIDNDAKTSNTVIVGTRTIALLPQHYSLASFPVDGSLISSCDPKTHVTTITIK